MSPRRRGRRGLRSNALRGYGVTVKLVRMNWALPAVMPTPLAKKQPPPKDTPTELTLRTAARKFVETTESGWPFQSDQLPVVSGTASVTAAPSAVMTLE